MTHISDRRALSLVSLVLRMQHIENIVLVEANDLLANDHCKAEDYTSPNGLCHLVVITRERPEVTQQLRVIWLVNLHRIDEWRVEEAIQLLPELVVAIAIRLQHDRTAEARLHGGPLEGTDGTVLWCYRCMWYHCTRRSGKQQPHLRRDQLITHSAKDRKPAGILGGPKITRRQTAPPRQSRRQFRTGCTEGKSEDATQQRLRRARIGLLGR